MKLTQTVQKGGCAAKVAAVELRKILSQVQFPPNDENVLVDGGLFDDAAIYKINSELALVQTLDFFTPIVDTPRIFGKIAAANALSDIYAMGGEPKTALAIFAFPLATLESAVAVEVLQGASEILREAKVSFVGGHSIDDETLKFGLSVTGYVHPNRFWSNANAKPGDILILTKALGTGTLTAALKRQALKESDISEALSSMTQLNRIVDLLPNEWVSAIHSATDVTGFGLMGHGVQMAKASQVSFEIDFHSLPVFDKAWISLKEGFLTKAHRTNSEYTEAFIQYSDQCKELPLHERQILFDPQTSGGLLLSIDPSWADAILEKIQKRFSFASKIGRVNSFQNQLILLSASKVK